MSREGSVREGDPGRVDPGNHAGLKSGFELENVGELPARHFGSQAPRCREGAIPLPAPYGILGDAEALGHLRDRQVQRCVIQRHGLTYFEMSGIRSP